MNITAKSILEMDNGAFMEQVDYEMKKVIENILDSNTRPTEKRKMTVTFVFEPDDDRQRIAVSMAVKTSLAATVPGGTSLYVTGDGSTGELQVVEMVPQIPGQMDLDGGEQQAPAKLRII